MVFNTVLAESAVEYDIMQEAKQIETVEDAERQLELIKAGKHKDPLKYINYVVSVVIPIVTQALTTGLIYKQTKTTSPLLAKGFTIIGIINSLSIALAQITKVPGPARSKYNNLVSLRDKVNNTISKIDNSTHVSPEAQKTIDDLTKFRCKLDKEIERYKEML